MKIRSTVNSLIPRWLLETRALSHELPYVPNVLRPRSFTEHLAHRKTRSYDPRFKTIADKWAVRAYVETKIEPSYLTKAFGAISSIAELSNLDTLPDRFVAKPTHMSGEIRFLNERNELYAPDFLETVARWLRADSHGAAVHAYWVKEMPKRVIFEERLVDPEFDVPLDYKFFVFRGNVALIQVDISRFKRHLRNLYTPDWELLPVRFCYPQMLPDTLGRPPCLDEMLRIASILGEDFDFMRVDLYAVGSTRVVFGELTPAPEAGRGLFSPISFDFDLGRKWAEASSSH